MVFCLMNRRREKSAARLNTPPGCTDSSFLSAYDFAKSKM